MKKSGIFVKPWFIIWFFKHKKIRINPKDKPCFSKKLSKLREFLWVKWKQNLNFINFQVRFLSISTSVRFASWWKMRMIPRMKMTLKIKTRPKNEDDTKKENSFKTEDHTKSEDNPKYEHYPKKGGDTKNWRRHQQAQNLCISAIDLKRLEQI